MKNFFIKHMSALSMSVLNWCLRRYKEIPFMIVPADVYLTMINENAAYEISYCVHIQHIALLTDERDRLLDVFNERTLIEQSMKETGDNKNNNKGDDNGTRNKTRRL